MGLVEHLSHDRVRHGNGPLRVPPAEGAAAVVPHSEPDVANGFAWVTMMLVKLDELGVVTRAIQVPLSTDAAILPDMAGRWVVGLLTAEAR